MRRLDEKIGILIDAQIKSEDRTAQLDEMMRTMQMRSDERFRITDERLAKSDERFAKFESQTDQTLKILKEIMRELRNGDSKS